jgi:hypothetical protein
MTAEIKKEINTCVSNNKSVNYIKKNDLRNNIYKVQSYQPLLISRNQFLVQYHNKVWIAESKKMMTPTNTPVDSYLNQNDEFNWKYENNNYDNAFVDMYHKYENKENDYKLKN